MALPIYTNCDALHEIQWAWDTIADFQLETNIMHCTAILHSTAALVVVHFIHIKHAFAFDEWKSRPIQNTRSGKVYKRNNDVKKHH